MAGEKFTPGAVAEVSARPDAPLTSWRLMSNYDDGTYYCAAPRMSLYFHERYANEQAVVAMVQAAPALYEALKGLDSVGQEIEGVIDEQTYDYAKTFHGDIPDDAEFNVNLTWKHIHALTAAINKARAALSQAQKE